MTRQTVRDMKRAIDLAARPGADAGRVLLSKECALSLLNRSVAFGHGRLAVIRLSMAVGAGAEPTADHWQYCRLAAQASQDLSLQTLYSAAALQAQARADGATEVH